MLFQPDTDIIFLTTNDVPTITNIAVCMLIAVAAGRHKVLALLSFCWWKVV